ncbi:hypothetical protein [Magnetospirillum sp. XM-1]|uniref:hypothetical protein n=1 Tax=Magnetospirillum sp. XM-1 TaxID=1663591 RepID=UPI0008391B5B|nr:hypothetical protein [Magnetospirillum sp. XM-1]
MTAVPCLLLGTVLAPTLAVGIALGRPHRVLAPIMVSAIAADRHLTATAAAILVLAAAPVNAPSAVISPPQPPGAPTATAKSP